jgi:hypothetical protein
LAVSRLLLFFCRAIIEILIVKTFQSIRLLELFDELKWPTSALANLAVYKDSPGVMEAIRKRGNIEVVG